MNVNITMATQVYAEACFKLIWHKDKLTINCDNGTSIMLEQNIQIPLR